MKQKLLVKQDVCDGWVVVEDVRGVVMNPVDHPHGGGEGKAPQGNPHPVTPWGKPTKGYKTRKKQKIF